ncbi:uncharacterized protein LOC120267053 [Dioscorea cayenensis subsp. rotundata]|uniref:Uncharacterized protein LOC120267053 n=1 Tax=Dioscorea cayennensis subsp. rotundata TaxID=55577 RepID=A0AB40BUZ0_DIOCR|nr:uncharacterized protein LOC120267053 [Dioscorea cayenensis subsp. rotundata]
MGNCQAAEAATVVIQHPGGRVERQYWPMCAAEVMRSNPGHYVALVTLCFSEDENKQDSSGVRLTRLRILKPKDTLLLGQVYRLISSQEVTRALRERKYEKMRRSHADMINQQQQQQQQHLQQQVAEQERERQKSSHSGAKERHWRPTLQSISEVVKADQFT